MTRTLANDDVRRLAHADLLLLLGDLLHDPCAPMNDVDLTPLLDSAGIEVHTPVGERWIALERAACDARTQPELARLERHRLFEGAMACPLNETVYVRRDKGAIISDICGFYQAFGFEPRPEQGEKPDHLVTQLEYLAMLLVMTASASGQGQADRAAIAQAAAQRFADDHIASWLGALTCLLRQVSRLTLHMALADALEATWGVLAQTHGWAELEMTDSPELGDLAPPADACESASTSALPQSVRIEGRPLPDP